MFPISPLSQRISIHAPLTGCDKERFLQNASLKQFQSTHPLRDATLRVPPFSRGFSYFNPRTPYGMRHGIPYNCDILCIISIHAPLTGCDIKSFKLLQLLAIFQSTHPLRDATALTNAIKDHVGISIHAPLTGCDRISFLASIKISISIHAPLTGCDQ